MNFTITDKPIDHPSLRETLSNPKAGAANIFEGIVRNHHEGRAVASLHYEAHEALAQKEGEAILREAAEKFDVMHVSASHRIGHLNIGDMAVWVGASAAHRAEAYEASRYIIEEIKKRLPIWKKEFWDDGEHHWVGDT